MMQSVTLGQQPNHTLKMNSDSNPTFKNGQILYGKINKLYPNQMAEVQIGNQKVLATLEAPLQAGERYLLQVQQNLGNILLKVLDTPEGNGKESAKQIMNHLGVVSNPQTTELAELLLKNQLPITKDSFQLAMQWLKQVDSPKEGLMALKTMFMQQLPFVEDVFKALFTQAKGESFTGMLHQLLTNINSSANQTVTTHQLKGVLESLIVPKQGQIQEIGLQKLISYWLNPNSSAGIKEGAFSLLQKTGFLSQLLSEVNSGIDLQSSGANIGKVATTSTEQRSLQLLMEYKSAMQNGNSLNSSLNKGLMDFLLDFANQNSEQVRQAKDRINKSITVIFPKPVRGSTFAKRTSGFTIVSDRIAIDRYGEFKLCFSSIKRYS